MYYDDELGPVVIIIYAIMAIVSIIMIVKFFKLTSDVKAIKKSLANDVPNLDLLISQVEEDIFTDQTDHARLLLKKALYRKRKDKGKIAVSLENKGIHDSLNADIKRIESKLAELDKLDKLDKKVNS